jgi:hypothetical protein
LSGKEKLERDYKEFDEAIEESAKKELEKIRRKALELKAEAEKVGAAVEASLEENQAKVGKKKS